MSDIPRSKYMKSRIFDRRKFLDGTYTVMFGPGQGPEVVNTYAPPTDWNRVNTLLDMPQIVWLIVSISDTSIPEKPGVLPQFFVTQYFDGDVIVAPGATGPKGAYNPVNLCTNIAPSENSVTFQGYATETVGDGTFNSSQLNNKGFYDDWYQQALEQSGIADSENAQFDHDFVNAFFSIQDESRNIYKPYFYDGELVTEVKDISVQEMGQPEANRIAAMYADIKNYLEKLRPGKIFVNILNYSYVPVGSGGVYNPLRPGYPDLGNGNFPIVYLPQILNNAKDTFLGLNLFAIVVGENAGGGVYDPSALLDTQQKLDRLSVTVYKPSVIYQQLSDYIGTNPVNDLLPALSKATYAPGSENLRTYFNNVWQTDDADVASLQKVGVNAYSGGFSADMKETTIIQAIADFYDFDPIFGENK